MPEEQENQIERREPGGINRRSETARRGSDAARFVGSLAKAKSELPSTVSPGHEYKFTLKWGTEGSGDGQFEFTSSVAVASDGSVYVADYGNHRIQKFTSEGVVVIKWGRYGTGDGNFLWPSGVAVASDGMVYVSDFGNHRIQKFTSEGVFVNRWGTYGTGDGQFDEPCGVAVASDGSVYVAAFRNSRIQKFSPVQ